MTGASTQVLHNMGNEQNRTVWIVGNYEYAVLAELRLEAHGYCESRVGLAGYELYPVF